MRILKPVFYSAIAITTLAGCSSVHNVAVPAGTNTITNISAKKLPLTDNQKDNWQHFDLATDSIPGMSVAKAYDYLKGKQGVEVIVAVIDSGIDLEHEDLKDVAWVNEKEIAGNGIDDDKNGYVDDIHGWNFLGKTTKELLEFHRIAQNPSIAGADEAAEVKEYYDKQVEEAKGNLEKIKQGKTKYEQLLQGVKNADEAFTKHFGKSDYTKEEVLAIKNNSTLEKHIDIAKKVFGFGMSSLKDAKADLKNGVNYFIGKLESSQDLISGEVLKKNYRSVVGDNPNDIKDSPGYGNNNTAHLEEDESHGSHVAGIIAASRNNSKGMDGVANNVKIMAVRAVPDGDEYDKDVALAIRYAADNGAKVMNTSFGKSYSPKKQWVYDAIIYAAKKDVLIVNAAGNSSENIDIENSYPRDAKDKIHEISDNFITIGAMSANYNEKLPASFTNFGKKNVDVFAPGVKIHATVPEGKYRKMSGTSMASPATAGVAALIRSYYPQLSASQVKHILMNSGTKIDLDVLKPGTKDLVPFADLSVSGRVVNAYNALRMADRIVNGKK